MAGVLEEDHRDKRECHRAVKQKQKIAAVAI